FGDAGLERMVAGMATARDQALYAKASRRMSSSVELRVGSKFGFSAGIAVGRIDARQSNARCSDVRGAEFHVLKEVVIETGRVAGDVTISEVPLDATDGQELWLVSGSERRQITLESREIDLSVRGQVGTAAGWEHGLSLNRVRRGQSHGQRGILKWNRDAGPRGDDRRQRKRNRRGKEIVLPEIGQHCRDSSACVEDGVSSQTVVNSQTRTPAL